MSFFTGIPGANDAFSVSQPQIQTNFNTINAGFGQDHVTWSGFHKQSTYVAGAGGSTSSSGQVVEYANSVTYANGAGTFSELFFKRDGVSTAVQMTTGPGNPVASANGVTYLPGGLILQWGQLVVPAGGSNTFSFPVSFPNQCFAAYTTTRAIGAFKSGLAIPTRTNVVVYLEAAAGGGQTVYVSAIGN